MNHALGFIVRVGASEPNGAYAFLGSGLLVAPDRVLTCRHVVREQTPFDQPTHDVRTGLAVQAADGPWVAVVDTVVTEAADLALLTLGTALIVPTIPPFLWGLSQALSERLRAAPLVVIGYAQRAAQGPLWQHPLENLWLLPSVREDSGLLSEVQLHGGIPAGCSGSPVLLPLGERWAYVGIVYLGGERSATSRLLLADPIVEFLHRCGLHGVARLDAVRALAGPAAMALIERPGASERLPNPYRGLSAFREVDAPYFFGRGDDAQKLFEAVTRQPFVALVGASGSGKSSLLFAGLVPRVRQTDDWRLAWFRPGRDPFEGAATALTPLLYPELDKLERREKRNDLFGKLSEGRLSLADSVAIWAEEHPEQRLLVIADQFEELYTQNLPEDRQRRFLDCLMTVIEGDDLPCALLLSLRADFLSQALGYAPLAEAIAHHPKHIVTPMTEEHLRAAIEGPAEQLGVSLEPGLTERMLKDLDEEPGTLPLLEFALTELWQRQASGRLTHGAYEAIGGVSQALAHHADSVAARFRGREAQLRRVFVQLVRPGEGTEDTRQVATREQVGEAYWPLVKELADARLVVTSAHEEGAQTVETVEVVHEALIRHWQPLREWINEDRQFRTWQNRLRQAFKDWQDTGQDEGALLRGARLAEAEEQLREHQDTLSAPERYYLGASIEQRDRETRAKRRRQRLTISSLVAGLLIFIGLSALAYLQAQKATTAATEAQAAEKRATAQKEQADRQRQTAISRLLAQEAMRLNETGQKATLIENAAALAVESWRRRKNPTAMAAAMKLLPMLPEVSVPHGGAVNDIAYSPDGSILVAASEDGSIQLTKADSGVQIRRYPYNLPTKKVKISPDGRLIASIHEKQTKSGEETPYIGRLLETETGREIAAFPLADSDRDHAAFSPDGRFFAFVSSKNEMRFLNTQSGREQFHLQVAKGIGVGDLVFSNDSHFLAATVRLGPSEKSAHLLSTERAKEVSRIHYGDWIQAPAFSPDSRVLASAHSSGRVRLTSTETGKEILNLKFANHLNDIAFSPNGQFLAVALQCRRKDGGCLDGSVHLLSTMSGKAVARIKKQKENCFRLHFSQDSRFLATSCMTVSHLVATETGVVLSETRHNDSLRNIAFSPDGKLLATASEDGTASLVATRDGHEIARLRHDSKVFSVLFSPDSQYLVTDSEYDDLRVFFTATGKELARLTERFQGLGFAFSPKSPTTLAWGDRDGSVRFFRNFDGIELNRIAPADAVKRFVVSPNGRTLASIHQSGTLRLATVPEGKVLAELSGFNEFSILTYSLDREYLAALNNGANGAFTLLASDSGTILANIKLGFSPIVLFSSDFRFIALTAITQEKRSTLLFDTASPARWLELPDNGFPTAFSPDGQFLATNGGWTKAGPSASLWNTASGEEAVRIPFDDSGWVEFSPTLRYMTRGWRHHGKISLEAIHTGEVITTVEHGKSAGSTFSPDGRFVATTSDDGSVKLLATDRGTEITSYVDPGGLKLVTFSSDSKFLATVTEQGHARLVECASGKNLGKYFLKASDIEYDNHDIIFSPTNRFVVFGRWHGDAKLVATGEGRVIAHISRLGARVKPRPLVFSPDERFLAVLHEDDVVSLWETTTGKTLGRIRHDRYVRENSFSQDARLFLTLSNDEVAHLVSTETGTEVAQYSPDGGIQGARFVSDGEVLVIGTKNGLRFYPSDPEVLFARLCAKAGANLSQEEWNDYIDPEEPWRATCPGLPVPER